MKGAETMNQSDLVGTWRLVSCELRNEAGDRTYPMGEDAVGYLTYTTNGYMSATLMQLRRLKFKGGDLLRGTPEEKIAAVDGYVAYCGRYRVEPGKVVHQVEMSLFPNWIGTDQERFVDFVGERIDLRTAPFLVQGKRQTAHLIWERAGS